MSVVIKCMFEKTADKSRVTLVSTDALEDLMQKLGKQCKI